MDDQRTRFQCEVLIPNNLYYTGHKLRHGSKKIIRIRDKDCNERDSRGKAKYWQRFLIR